MPLHLLAQPLFLVSVLSLVACGAWAVWYLRRGARHHPVSAEIARVMAGANASARGVLNSHRSHLDRLAARLVERETLEADDLEVVLAGVNRRAAASGRSRDPRRQAGRGRSGVDGTQSPQPTTYPVTAQAKEFFGLGAAFSASSDHNGRY